MTTKPNPINWSTLTPHERDALVAEKGMGWKKRTVRKDLTGKTDFLDHGAVLIECGVFLNRWSPTTDLAAAMHVVEEMRRRKLTVVILSYVGNSYWGVGFGDFPRMDCPTLPEAICLAALRACGVEVKQ